ncbi:hypothetical protein EL22_23750 [Halostagnicola sp. A56]|nr:hypothetical protein EL22_23750 [Halostagnicola sp. A56]
MLLFYAGLAMLATPESRIGERERIAPLGPIGGRYFSEKPRRPVSFIPPIYPKNLRFVVPTTAIGMLIATGAGGGVTVWGVGRGSPLGGDVTDFFALFTALAKPPVLVVGLAIVGAHLVPLSRYYFATGRYRDLTAHMALETQVKYYAVYLYFFLALTLYALVTFFVIGLAHPVIVSDSTSLVIWKGVVAGTFLALKLAFERSRIRGERRPSLDDDSFTANFSPTPPPAESRK